MLEIKTNNQFFQGFMMNIQFSYLYRDAGNFKNFGDVIFSNTSKLSLDELRSMITKALIDEMFFDAFKSNIPPLFFEDYDDDLDHDWHEFDQFNEVNSLPNDVQNRDIERFISILAEGSV